MKIRNRAEYDAAALRANALSDAPEGAPAAEELAELVAALREWTEVHEGEQCHGPEPLEGLTRPDDMSISGLPGNIGRLHKG